MIHPAIPQLLKSHAASRLRRISNGFSTPRRIVLSLVVVGLMILWLGQTVASVLMRDPWQPEVFRNWVSLPLMVYFLWHIIRVAWKRPEEAIEWSPEEEALVVGGPFSRTDVLTYRLAVILTATLPKAALTAFVLWPDLSWSGPIGLVLALVGLELFRLVMDLATSCLTERGYLCFRTAVLMSAMAAVASGYHLSQSQLNASAIESSIPVPMTQQAMAMLQAVRHTSFTAQLERPFQFTADVIAGQGSAGSLLAGICSLLIVLAGLWRLALYLDNRWLQIQLAKEVQLWKNGTTPKLRDASTDSGSVRLPRVSAAARFTALVWRQSKRAWRYAGSLLVSMGIPALLALLPMYSIPNPTVAFVFVVCGVIFYTFVLLPEAIKFDFRLDADHVTQLRMLPLSSRQLVLSQLTTPVILACIFQAFVIAWAGVAREIAPAMVATAICITLPLTVIFVAIDNLVFLLYPHRPTQEGFEAFLRTILKFTGKSLLLVLAGGTLLIWAPAASHLARNLFRVPTSFVFYTGICGGVSLLAAMSVQMVVRAWDRYDVSIDVA